MDHDPSRVYGENNIFRYTPVKGILARVENMSDDDVAILLLGAKLCGVLLHLSIGASRPWIQKMHGYYASLSVETEAELIGRMPEALQGVRFLRGTDISEALVNAAHARDVEVLDRPVLAMVGWNCWGISGNRLFPKPFTATAISSRRRAVLKQTACEG